MNRVRVAIYARVSTLDQDPDGQLIALRDFAKQRNFEIYKEYVDYVSGDVGKRNRRRSKQDNAYRQLMDDARRRLIDCVIVWKYDRFARSLEFLVSALQEFGSLGVDFISYTQNIDTTTPMGRLFFHVIASFAEFERDLIVERVRVGLEKAKANGVTLGRPQKDPSAIPRIITMRQQGLSLRKIAKLENLSAPGVMKILRRAAIEQKGV